MTDPANTTAQVEANVLEVIAKVLHRKECVLPPEAKFAEDLDMDSLRIVEMIMALEETFGLTISSEDAKRLVTVQDALALVKAACSNR